MITVKYGVRSITIESGLTINQLLASEDVQVGLRATGNLRAVVNGVTAEGGTRLQDGDEVILETRANQKACDFYVTVRYGARSATAPVNDGDSVGDVVNTDEVRSVLRLSGNLRYMVNGVTVDPSREVESGDEISIETRANQKATSLLDVICL